MAYVAGKLLARVALEHSTRLPKYGSFTPGKSYDAFASVSNSGGGPHKGWVFICDDNGLSLEVEAKFFLPVGSPALKSVLQPSTTAPGYKKPKPAPELPPECRRDDFGFNRAGVDFMAHVRKIAESTKHEGKKATDAQD